ncbi:major facilitator superfamily domain-containing protein 1-like [Pelobates fuscus]|uniref:major facilitator superfamily domain-containing protein 1-like n=1 Tax=Pelobates fuscus TaxID=191477 RepID=UPI002FE45F9D
MAVTAEKTYYRFLVLFFTCLLTFGSYFCFDIPSVLQDQFQGNITFQNGTSTNHSGGCVDGLGMSPEEYNLLYAIYAWTNALVVIMAGYLIDKLGNRFGLFLFSFLTVLGSAIFALGSHFKGTPYLLPLMLTGRLLFGSGNGSLTIVQNRVTAFWFKGKELALAFGLTLSFSRLGSVLNFFFTQQFESHYGIQWTLWGGTILCVLGFLAAITVSILDKVGMKQLGLDGAMQEESKKVRVQDVRHLPLRYWLLVLTIMFFYNGVFPFVADASKFIQDKYEGYDQKTAAYVAGAVYDSSLVLSAAVGILIDYVGMRGVLAALCAILTLPVFALLAFTFVPPLVSTLWLGVTYSFAAASMWPSIPLVVPQATLGTAMGLATSVQMIGIGLSNLIVGKILGTKSSERKIPLWRWQQMMIFMLANTIACIATSVILNIVDKKQGGTLNKMSKRAESESGDESDRTPILNAEDDRHLD